MASSLLFLEAMNGALSQDKFEHVAADVTGIISGCRCLLSSIRVRHM